MARRASSKAVATIEGNTALANVDAMLAAEVEAIKETIGSPETNAIRIKDKMFAFPDGQLKQGPIEMVIVDYTSMNVYYQDRWDPNNPVPPTCFAINKKIADMAPSDNAPDKQAENCTECPMNQFGSDGNGKACKNQRVLALIDPNDNPEDAPIYTLKVSPTAIKGFDGYVGMVAKSFQRPPVGVITKIGFHPEKSYAQLIFGGPEPNTDVAAHLARRDEAADILAVEPNTTVLDTAAAPKKAAPRRRAR